MKKHKTHLLIASILASVMTGGCQMPDWEKWLPDAVQANPAPSTEKPGAAQPQPKPQPEQQADLPGLPATLVLPPGAKLSLPYGEGISYQSSLPDLVSVSAKGELFIPADAPTGEEAKISVDFQGQKKQAVVRIKPSLQDTVKVVNGIPTVTNPADRVVVVNKSRSLPADYVPEDLVEPNVPFSFPGKAEKRMLRAEAAKALEALFARAKQHNVQLYGVSGYRSYKTQQALYANYVRTQGEEHASRYSAHPGKSEHQTGLAIDVSGADKTTRLEEPFAHTPEGKWLERHASEFGFIIRYPRGKEALTGYAYEPWHLRYVGKKVAQEITARGITLEEYFQDAVPVGKIQLQAPARK